MNKGTVRQALSLLLTLVLPLAPLSTALAGRVIPPDLFERDRGPFFAEFNALLDGIPQDHWFHTSTDQDWYVLDAYLGEDNIIEISETLPPGRGGNLLTLNVRIYDASDYCLFPVPGQTCTNTPVIERNRCQTRPPPQVGTPVSPISLSTRNGVIASTVYVVIRDCFGEIGDDIPYSIELLDRSLPPPFPACEIADDCVPRSQAANVTGTVVMALGNQPVGFVSIQTSTNASTFSSPLSGNFSLLVEAGGESITLQANGQFLELESVAPELIGPFVEGEKLQGVQIVMRPSDVLFRHGFEP